MAVSGGVALLGALLTVLSSAWMTSGVVLTPEVMTGLSNYSFHEDFIFGVASAAFQIEGAWNTGGRGPSMWDVYLHEHPNYTVDGSNGDVAADSYHLYKEDVQMIKSLGAKYYRLSISWSRILPAGTDHYINEEGVKYYLKLFHELIRNDITPVVTIFHWDLPQMFMDIGGWANPLMVDYFRDYARVLFEIYGHIVKIWGTINEPHQHCYNGYGNDYFVPALKAAGIGDYLCSHHLLLAHAKVYHLYDSKYRALQKGKIGITLDAFYGEPEDYRNLEHREAVERYLQMHLGLYAHPIYSASGDYPELVRQRVDNMSLHQGFQRSRLPYFTPKEVQMLKGSSDYFGLNHYTTYLMASSSMEPDWRIPSMDHDTGVRMSKHPSWPKPGAEWCTHYPQGFRKLINWISKEYGKEVPIIITENGSSDFGGIKDYLRVAYFNNYLYQLLKAIHEDGDNVVGYFAWTLMDDFEWTDGYKSKFGLYHVDFESPDKTRTAKLSAYNYKEILRTRRINFDYIKAPNSASSNRI